MSWGSISGPSQEKKKKKGEKKGLRPVRKAVAPTHQNGKGRREEGQSMERPLVWVKKGTVVLWNLGGWVVRGKSCRVTVPLHA